MQDNKKWVTIESTSFIEKSRVTYAMVEDDLQVEMTCAIAIDGRLNAIAKCASMCGCEQARIIF